jgi:hypothetical protein
MIFEDISGKTLIVDTWELDPDLPGIIERLSVKPARSAVKENLLKLKQLLETGTVTLQDGRMHRIPN